ncbi:MAG: hypothetical protein ACHQ4F_07705 [Candidatus Dormibacteria bacterium]
MSDESSRSARPYGQRRNDGAPAWWAALDRADLPDNEVVPAAHRRWYEDAQPVAPMVEIAGRSRHSRKRQIWLISVLVALAIAGVLYAGFKNDFEDTWNVVVVALLISVPVALAACVTILLARRNS